VVSSNSTKMTFKKFMLFGQCIVIQCVWKVAVHL
jgi:hypothetical protein